MKLIRILSLLGIAVTAVFLVIYIVHLQQVNVKNFTFQPTVVTKYEFSNYNEYFALENGIYRVTKNGVSKIADDGTVEWNKSFTLEKPVVYKSADYFVVGDLEGYQFYVFDKTGFLYEKRVEKEIIKGDVNGNGDVTIVEAQDDRFVVEVYRKNSDLALRREMYYKSEGYPVFATLSEDSQNLVIATTLGIGKTIQSNLTFMNLGTFGQNVTDDITGILTFEDTIIGIGRFIDNSHFFAVADDRLLTFTVDPKPKMSENTVTVANRIQKVAFNKNGAYIYYGPAFEYEEEGLRDTIVCYNGEGKKQFEIPCDEPVQWMTATNDLLMVTSDNTFKIYQNARKIRQQTLDKELLGVYGIQNNKYLFVYYNEFVIGQFKKSETKE